MSVSFTELTSAYADKATTDRYRMGFGTGRVKLFTVGLVPSCSSWKFPLALPLTRFIFP